MTESDFLKKLLVEYQEYEEELKDFENAKELKNFWAGACFALEIAIKEIEKNA